LETLSEALFQNLDFPVADIDSYLEWKSYIGSIRRNGFDILHEVSPREIGVPFSSFSSFTQDVLYMKPMIYDDITKEDIDKYFNTDSYIDVVDGEFISKEGKRRIFKTSVLELISEQTSNKFFESLRVVILVLASVMGSKFYDNPFIQNLKYYYDYLESKKPGSSRFFEDTKQGNVHFEVDEKGNPIIYDTMVCTRTGLLMRAAFKFWSFSHLFAKFPKLTKQYEDFIHGLFADPFYNAMKFKSAAALPKLMMLSCTQSGFYIQWVSKTLTKFDVMKVVPGMNDSNSFKTVQQSWEENISTLIEYFGSFGQLYKDMLSERVDHDTVALMAFLHFPEDVIGFIRGDVSVAQSAHASASTLPNFDDDVKLGALDPDDFVKDGNFHTKWWDEEDNHPPFYRRLVDTWRDVLRRAYDDELIPDAESFQFNLINHMTQKSSGGYKTDLKFSVDKGREVREYKERDTSKIINFLKGLDSLHISENDIQDALDMGFALIPIDGELVSPQKWLFKNVTLSEMSVENGIVWTLPISPEGRIFDRVTKGRQLRAIFAVPLGHYIWETTYAEAVSNVIRNRDWQVLGNNTGEVLVDHAYMFYASSWMKLFCLMVDFSTYDNSQRWSNMRFYMLAAIISVIYEKGDNGPWFTWKDKATMMVKIMSRLRNAPFRRADGVVITLDMVLSGENFTLIMNSLTNESFVRWWFGKLEEININTKGYRMKLLGNKFINRMVRILGDDQLQIWEWLGQGQVDVDIISILRESLSSGAVNNGMDINRVKTGMMHFVGEFLKVMAFRGWNIPRISVSPLSAERYKELEDPIVTLRGFNGIITECVSRGYPVEKMSKYYLCICLTRLNFRVPTFEEEAAHSDLPIYPSIIFTPIEYGGLGFQSNSFLSSNSSVWPVLHGGVFEEWLKYGYLLNQVPVRDVSRKIVDQILPQFEKEKKYFDELLKHGELSQIYTRSELARLELKERGVTSDLFFNKYFYRKIRQIIVGNPRVNKIINYFRESDLKSVRTSVSKYNKPVHTPKIYHIYVRNEVAAGTLVVEYKDRYMTCVRNRSEVHEDVFMNSVFKVCSCSGRDAIIVHIRDKYKPYTRGVSYDYSDRNWPKKPVLYFDDPLVTLCDYNDSWYGSKNYNINEDGIELLYDEEDIPDGGLSYNHFKGYSWLSNIIIVKDRVDPVGVEFCPVAGVDIKYEALFQYIGTSALRVSGTSRLLSTLRSAMSQKGFPRDITPEQIINVLTDPKYMSNISLLSTFLVAMGFSYDNASKVMGSLQQTAQDKIVLDAKVSFKTSVSSLLDMSAVSLSHFNYLVNPLSPVWTQYIKYLVFSFTNSKVGRRLYKYEIHLVGGVDTLIKASTILN
jgi:hypothetical protein